MKLTNQFIQIEETAKDIVKRVDDLGKHLKSYEEYHQKLGNSLSTTVNHYVASGKEFKKLDKDIYLIHINHQNFFKLK